MTTHAGANGALGNNGYGDLAAALIDELLGRLGGQVPQPQLAAVTPLPLEGGGLDG